MSPADQIELGTALLARSMNFLWACFTTWGARTIEVSEHRLTITSLTLGFSDWSRQTAPEADAAICACNECDEFMRVRHWFISHVGSWRCGCFFMYVFEWRGFVVSFKLYINVLRCALVIHNACSKACIACIRYIISSYIIFIKRARNTVRHVRDVKMFWHAPAASFVVAWHK